jgi:hypothetical protein
MPSATVQPALIIGLGGSGIDIVRRFKRRFSTLYPDTPYVRLLGIDTAPQVAASASLPALSDDEFIYTAQFNMTHYVGAGRLDQNPTIRSWWRGYDSLPLKAVATGAGQRRPVGRLALFVQHGQVVERLKRNVQGIFNDRHFAGLQNHYKQLINVYIVASTCGGTGTGMFLDLAYIARDVVRQSMPGVTPRVRSILLLPSVFIETGAVPGELNRAHLRANAYGALTELDFAMSASSQLREVEYPDGRRVPREEAPFKGCYLVGNQTSSGSVISRMEEVLEKAATHLMIELASPLSNTGEAILDNIIDRIATNGPSQGRPRLYSSFTGDWLELPSARVIARWTKLYSLRVLERLRGTGRRTERGDGALQQLRLAEGYGTLKDLVAGTGLRRFEPRVEPALNAFLDITEDGEAPATLVQRAQVLNEDAERQIRTNPALATIAEDATDRVFPEIESQVRSILAEGSLSEARQLLTEAQAELETWLTRSRERSSVPPGQWLSDFARQANETTKSLFQTKKQHASRQREMVIDAADAARRAWDEQLRARIGHALEDRLPAVLAQVRQLRQQIEQMQVAVDGALTLIARFTEPGVAPGAAGVAADDGEIDQAFHEPQRLEALDISARESLGTLLAAANDPDAFAAEVWSVASHAVRIVAPEYLRRLHISTDTISERVNRLSPLAVFTGDWDALRDAASVEGLCLIGLPESMSDREGEVKSGIDASVRAEVQVIIHGDDERVVMTKQQHGFPLYALAEIEQCRHAFESSDALTRPLRFILQEQQARSWSILPLDAQTSQSYFALALALEWIRRAGQEYIYQENRNGAEIVLGAAADPIEARQQARDTFLRAGLSSAVKAYLDGRVRAEGNEALYTQLGQWIEKQEQYAAKPEYPADFRREIDLVRKHQQSIRPF